MNRIDAAQWDRKDDTRSATAASAPPMKIRESTSTQLPGLSDSHWYRIKGNDIPSEPCWDIQQEAAVYQ